MNSLANLSCTTHYKNEQKLGEADIKQYLEHLNDWQLSEHSESQLPLLERTFPFKGYLQGVEFTQQVAKMAEQQNHHPEIRLTYGKVTISWWTHALKGLHLNDFICAAKCDEIYIKLQVQ